MDKALFDYITAHMTKTTHVIDNLLFHFPGTLEDKESAFLILTEYYEAVVEHLKAAESINFACRTLHDMQKEEREKNRQLPGFDSIRPTHSNKSPYGPCPCGGTNMYDPLVIFTSMPPQYQLVCNKCGKTTYVTVD